MTTTDMSRIKGATAAMARTKGANDDDFDLALEQIEDMSDAEKLAIAADMLQRQLGLLQRQADLLLQIGEQRDRALEAAVDAAALTERLVEKACEALDTVAAQRDEAKIRIIDDDEPVRLSGDLPLVEAQRLLRAALPEIHLLLNVRDKSLIA